jgi:hypothetical protein
MKGVVMWGMNGAVDVCEIYVQQGMICKGAGQGMMLVMVVMKDRVRRACDAVGKESTAVEC